MKKEGKKWMLVALALLAVVTVALPLVGCKNDTVAEQTGDGTGSGDGNQGTGDQGSGSGNQGSGDPEQPVTYTVSFKTNEGSTVPSQTVERGKTATKPADPTLENNVFGGWYSDEELTSEYDFTTSVTGSFTLYAKWVKRIEVDAYDVSFGIAELTGDGSYILVATGKWSSDDLSRLANELKDESKKVNLDLSEATGLTRIGFLAFDGCDSLTSISIPEGVKSIDGNAFQGCSGLTSIDLSKATGLTTIGYGAFDGCIGLTSISIPSSVTSIGEVAFYECSSLEEVTMEANTPPELGIWAFNGTADTLQILVPSGSEEAYWEAENWKEYSGKIKAIPDQTSQSSLKVR